MPAWRYRHGVSTCDVCENGSCASLDLRPRNHDRNCATFNLRKSYLVYESPSAKKSLVGSAVSRSCCIVSLSHEFIRSRVASCKGNEERKKKLAKEKKEERRASHGGSTIRRRCGGNGRRGSVLHIDEFTIQLNPSCHSISLSFSSLSSAPLSLSPPL